MADQSTAEIGTSTHAVIDRASKNLLTPEEKRRIDATKKEMGENRRSPLQAMETRGMTEDRMQIGIKSNIAEGSERPKVGGGTEKLQDVAGAAARRANIFLKEGFDSPNLTGSDKAMIFREVESSLAKLWPEANDILSKMPAPDRQGFVKDILRNPDYQDAVQSLLGETLSKTKEGGGVLLRELTDKHEDIVKKQEENKKNIDANNKKKEDAERKLAEEFNGAGGKKGKLAKELADLSDPKKVEKRKDDKALLDSQKTAKEREVTRLNNAYNAMLNRYGGITESERTAMLDNIKTAENDLQEIEKNLVGIQREDERLEELQQMKKGYETESENADTEDRRLQDEKEKLGKEELGVKAELELERLKSGSSEVEFMQGLEQVFGKATLEHMKQQLQKADAAQIQALDKLAKEKGDEVAKEVSKKLQTRWSETKKGFLGREKHPLKKDQINSDFRYLMDKDPDDLIKLMFPQDADKVTPEHKQEILEGLVRKKIEATGLSQGEARRIFDSAWGSGLIDSALAKNAKFNESIDRLKSADGFSGSTREFINKNKYKWGGAILLGALLGYIGPLTAITGLAAASKAAIMR